MISYNLFSTFSQPGCRQGGQRGSGNSYGSTISRATALALVLAIIFAGMMSCSSDKSSDTPDIVTENIDTIAVTEPPETQPFDKVPQLDYDGYEFNVLTLSSGINATSRFTQEIWVENENGETINDAVFTRNGMILDRLNVKILAVSVDDVYNTAKQAILAGDDAYDLHGMYSKGRAATLATMGLTRDWYEIPIIDMSAEWWNSKCSETLSVLGRLYMMSGAILISEIDDELAMIYNKQLAVDYNMESIYDLVFDGSWTLDTFAKQALAVHSDINGDGVMKPGDDLFGYIQDPASMSINWVFSCDLLKETLDDEGKLSLNVNIDRVQSMLERLSEVMKADTVNIGLDLYVGLDYFIADQIYIYAIILRNIELLRDMESDFGIIPYPKFDEAQPEYLNHVGSASPILTIPITNISDDELLGNVLEAMAIASYQVVRPAYFEVALKEKYARDGETQQMLDIILESRTYNLGYIGGCSIVSVIAPMIKSGSTDFASTWASRETSMLTQYQNFIDKIIAENQK